MTMLVNSDRATLGKIFENAVAQAFRELPNTRPVSWKRLLDSRAAGNFVGPAPADFELIVRSPSSLARPYVYYLECKSSDKYSEFSPFFRGAIKSQQRAELMIKMRAGCGGLYLFFSSQTQMVEVWSAQYINKMWPEKRKQLDEEPMLRFALNNMEEFANIITSQPETFTKGSGI